MLYLLEVSCVCCSSGNACLHLSQLNTPPVFVWVSELPAQLLVLYSRLFYFFFRVNYYYGYAVEIFSICISNAIVMFESVLFGVVHFRVEGNTTFLSNCSQIHELGQKKAIQRRLCTGANVLSQAAITNMTTLEEEGHALSHSVDPTLLCNGSMKDFGNESNSFAMV
jgi:hypothetical protein